MILSFVASLLIQFTSAQSVSWMDNELTFAPQEISRFIAKSLPEQWTPADRAGGVYFKNNPYFFCRREVNGKVFCHVYVKGGYGDLQRMDIDHDYGIGSYENYLLDRDFSTPADRTSKVTVRLQNGIFYFRFKGKLATRLSERFFPDYEQVVEWNNQQYMKYKGRLIQCAHPLNFKDQAECQLAVPTSPDLEGTPTKRPPPKLNNELSFLDFLFFSIPGVKSLIS